MPRVNGQQPERSDERLLEQMRAELGELAAEGEVEEFLPVVQRLQRWHAPEPNLQQQEALVDLLTEELAPCARPKVARALAEWWPALLLRSQVHVVRREIWAASALIMAIGVLVTMFGLATNPAITLTSLPFVILAPAAAAIGVAFLYDPSNEAVLQLEISTPVTARLLLLTRLLLLFGFNLAVALTGSLFLAWWEPSLSLWPLVLGWLAPMTLLASLAYLLTAIAFDPVVSMLISLSFWTLQHLRRLWDTTNWFWFIPDLTTTGAALWPFALAFAFGLVALWLSGREARWQGLAS